MTLAEQFQNAVTENLKENEWYDGETDLAEAANQHIAETQFAGKGFKRGYKFYFKDGSVAVQYGVTVALLSKVGV